MMVREVLSDENNRLRKNPSTIQAYPISMTFRASTLYQKKKKQNLFIYPSYIYSRLVQFFSKHFMQRHIRPRPKQQPIRSKLMIDMQVDRQTRLGQFQSFIILLNISLLGYNIELDIRIKQLPAGKLQNCDANHEPRSIIESSIRKFDSLETRICFSLWTDVYSFELRKALHNKQHPSG